MPQHINIDPPESFFSIGWWKKPSPWWEDGIWRDGSFGVYLRATLSLINDAVLDGRDAVKSLTYSSADIVRPYERTETVGLNNEN